MSERQPNLGDEAGAFQKIWGESLSRLMQAAFTFPPGSAPPELLRQLRAQMFQALSESWNEFLRSPEFQQAMKQWLDAAVAFRQATRDALSRARREMQAPSRDDVDATMLAVRRVETRLLDRMEELAKQIDELKSRPPGAARKTPAKSHRRTSARARAAKK